MAAGLEEIITKDRGIEFVDLCEDINPIHRDGNIVQGLQLASFVIKHSQPDIERQIKYKLSSIGIKFKKSALYNEPLMFISSAEMMDDSSLRIKGKGLKSNNEEFIEVEMKYSQQLPSKNNTGENADFIYERIITPNDVQRYCRSINIDYDLFKVTYLREFFVSTFTAGALCGMIRKKDLPEGKVAIFARQHFDFYDFPNYDFGKVSIRLKKVKDTHRATEVAESCYIDDCNIINGLSLLLKVPDNGK